MQQLQQNKFLNNTFVLKCLIILVTMDSTVLYQNLIVDKKSLRLQYTGNEPFLPPMQKAIYFTVVVTLESLTYTGK